MKKEDILQTLQNVKDPDLGRDIVALGMVKDVKVEDGKVFIHLEVPHPNPGEREKYKKLVNEHLSQQSGIQSVLIQISEPSKAGASSRSTRPSVSGISHVIAIASGKGGVGKSTAAVNLACALVKLGHKVGLMDGDIYGPNIPLMMGIPFDKKPMVTPQDKMEPLEAHGLKVISMGVLIPPDQPMVWRGPMLHSAITQFIQKVDWGELDFLLIDLPPGTGDVQLSLVQTVSLDGAVIITTPQEVSLMDVRKGIMMFKKTEVPLLGILENMTGEIFGKGGGKKAAEQFGAPYLGDVPLDARLRECGDEGLPMVLKFPESPAAQSFLKAAEFLAKDFAHV